MTSAIVRPDPTVSPMRKSGSNMPGAQQKPPSASVFCRSTAKPSNGARMSRLAMFFSATCTARTALARFSRATFPDAFVVSRWLWTSFSICA